MCYVTSTTSGPNCFQSPIVNESWDVPIVACPRNCISYFHYPTGLETGLFYPFFNAECSITLCNDVLLVVGQTLSPIYLGSLYMAIAAYILGISVFINAYLRFEFSFGCFQFFKTSFGLRIEFKNVRNYEVGHDYLCGSGLPAYLQFLCLPVNIKETTLYCFYRYLFCKTIPSLISIDFIFVEKLWNYRPSIDAAILFNSFMYGDRFLVKMTWEKHHTRLVI